MAATMRKAVTQVTDVIFPPPKNYKDIQHYQLLQKANDYVSSLPLQMCLYFNAFYFPLWLISCIVMLELKFVQLSTLYQVVLIAVLSVMTVIEMIRLYIGYVGNLTEQVPELAGSWLLTVLLQLPLILFLLLNEDTIILPLERAVHIVMTCFVALEVILGFFAIRAMVDYQSTKFHLQQFTDIQHMDSGDMYDPVQAQQQTYGYDNRYTR